MLSAKQQPLWSRLHVLYCQLISPLCCIYVSVNSVIIGSVNGLSPIQRQAII